MKQANVDFVIQEVLHVVRHTLMSSDAPLSPKDISGILSDIDTRIRDEYKYILRGPVRGKR